MLTTTDVRRLLDKSAPGRGVDAYDNSVRDHAMAYALLTSAAVRMGDIKWAEMLAQWLLDNAIDNGSAYGWGLGFEWNPFRKETLNPADAVYGITVALVVESLLDLYEVTGNEKYVNSACRALQYYKSFFSESEFGGFFWYADQEGDGNNAHNVSIMLSSQYARIVSWGRNDFCREIPMKSYADFMSYRKEHLGFRYWEYADCVRHPNDLVHASYVAYGAKMCAHYLGIEHDAKQDIDYLATFVKRGIAMEFSMLHELSHRAENTIGRLWGVGMAIAAAARAGEFQVASELTIALEGYRLDDGSLTSTPQKNAVNEPRMLSHVMFGLAEYERMGSCAVPKSLT